MPLTMSQMEVQLALILNDCLILASGLQELQNKIQYARTIPHREATRRTQTSASQAPALPNSSQTRLQTEEYEEYNFTPCNSECCLQQEEGQHGGLPSDWERL